VEDVHLFKTKSTLEHKGEEVTDTTTKQTFKNFDELTNAYGNSIFDKALSADGAQIVRSEKSILESAGELKDLEASKENLATSPNSETLSEVEGAETNLTNTIGNDLNMISGIALQKNITKACENYKNSTIDKTEETLKWIIKGRLIMDVLLTSEVEEWINKAIKVKFITPTKIAKIKMDLLNFLQLKDESQYIIREEDSGNEIQNKIEDLTIALKKYSLCTDF